MFLDSTERANITTSKLPTQKYHPKPNDVKHSTSNQSNSRGSTKKTPIIIAKDSTFTDEDDDLFSAIKMEEVKQELPDGDDDIFQSIETLNTSIELHVNQEPR